MNIAIIGGGITGLTAAYYLSKHNVTIFDNNFGGLAGAFKINNTYLEKYYHHFFKSDKYIINLIKELKLINKVLWNESRVGFFFKNKIYNFSTPFDLLSFRPLSFIDRIKLGFYLLYFKYNNNRKKFDKQTVSEFFRNTKKIYNVLWKPMLKIKFGDEYNNISNAFLWGRLNARVKSRKGLKEVFGYLDGSFKTLTDKLIEEIKKKNNNVIYSKVKKIKKIKDKFEITADKKYIFDKVLVTAQIPDFLQLCPVLPKDYIKQLKKIGYNAIICLVLKLRKKISDIYWLNNIDPNIVFGGVIEHTNLISSEVYKSHIIYLFNYINKKNKLYKLNNKEIFNLYIKDLKKVFPNFNEKDIINYYVFRDDYATPIYIKNYSKIIPKIKTPVKNLYLANISQIYPLDRNISHSIRLAELVVKIIEKDI